MKGVFNIICLIIGMNVFSQGYNVLYEVDFKPKKDSSLILKERYSLNIDTSNNVSKFMPISASNSLNVFIFKDFNKNYFCKYQFLMQDLYRTDYKNEFIHWTLQENEKQILEYTCNQAEINFAGREWVAFYASNIPLQDGPYKFMGLPGLILEIYSKDGDYHFLAKGIEKSKKQIKDLFTISAAHFSNSEKELGFKKEIVKDPLAHYRKSMFQLKNSNISFSTTYNGRESSPREIETSVIRLFKEWQKEHDNPIEKGDIWLK